MLLTRCPSCRTTFRITTDALHKAGGRVRCGRCSAVFNAHEELGKADAAASEAPAASKQQESGTPAMAPPVETPAATVQRAAASSHEPSGGASAAGAESTSAPGAELAFNDAWLAQVLGEIERSDADGADNADGEAAAGGAMTPEQVEAVLEQQPEPRPPDWQAPAPGQDPHAAWWRYGSAIAAALLAVQAVHYLRADLAGNALVGPLVQGVYGVLGGTVVPVWDVQQYQIMEWTAAAESNTQGHGSLNITARIHNRGPHAQPYPYVHLQLKDRWERTVASRIFTPQDYLPADARDAPSMPPGATARARLEVVDPGSDAYGFELDVCVEAAGGTLNCAADAIFRRAF